MYMGSNWKQLLPIIQFSPETFANHKLIKYRPMRFFFMKKSW